MGAIVDIAVDHYCSLIAAASDEIARIPRPLAVQSMDSAVYEHKKRWLWRRENVTFVERSAMGNGRFAAPQKQWSLANPLLREAWNAPATMPFLVIPSGGDDRAHFARCLIKDGEKVGIVTVSVSPADAAQIAQQSKSKVWTSYMTTPADVLTGSVGSG